MVGIVIFFFFFQVLQSYRNELCFFLIWLIVTVTFLFSELLSQEFRSELFSEQQRARRSVYVQRRKIYSSLYSPFLSLPLLIQAFSFFFLISLTRGLSVLLISSKTHRHLALVSMLLLLLGHFSRVGLCATPQTAAHQAPPSLGFSRQEHWSGLPFPSPMHESEKCK